MKQGLKLIAIIILMLAASAACTGVLEDDEGERGEIQGPALVMFYTDN